MSFHAKAESAIVLLLDGPENYQKISVVYPRKNPGLLQYRSVPDRGKALPARRTKAKTVLASAKMSIHKNSREFPREFCERRIPGNSREFPNRNSRWP